MNSNKKRVTISVLLAWTVTLMFTAVPAQAQCPGGSQQQLNRSQQNVLRSTLLQRQQQNALLTAAQQSQQNALLTAWQRQQYALLVALRQQQQQNALLAAALQQRQNATEAQLPAIQLAGDR